jgi:hypothetical protein
MREDGRKSDAGRRIGEGRKMRGDMRWSKGADLKSAAAVKSEGWRKSIAERKLSAFQRRRQGNGPWQSAKGKRIWRRRTTAIDGLIGKRWLERVLIRLRIPSPPLLHQLLRIKLLW